MREALTSAPENPPESRLPPGKNPQALAHTALKFPHGLPRTGKSRGNQANRAGKLGLGENILEGKIKEQLVISAYQSPIQETNQVVKSLSDVQKLLNSYVRVYIWATVDRQLRER